MIDIDTGYEPHHQTITKEDQVQIYEMVSIDVNLEPTTILTRAFKSVKDNRLVPVGFKVDHEVYDTTMIIGKALSDPNFNHSENEEGSGSDAIIYKIDVASFDGVFDVNFRVWYQSIPPEWTDELFSVTNPTIDLFKSMYDSIKAVPEFIAAVSLDSIVHMTTAVNNHSLNKEILLFPNPTNGHQVSIKGIDQLNGKVEITLTNLFGQQVFTQGIFNHSVQLQADLANGTYIVSLFQDGRLIYTTRLILME